MISRYFAATATALMVASAAQGQDWTSTYSLYGTPGLIEMPTAGSFPDGQIGATLGYFGPHVRGTVSFQITPRLTGTFRYARMENLDNLQDSYFDRSMDLHFRLVDETEFRPAIAIGLRDFLGTGLYSSEYVVASKSFGSRVRATAGIGWGQMGSRGGFRNPLASVFGDNWDERRFASRDAVTGGTVQDQQFFKGHAAFFGGIEYTINSSWRFLAEYSSDEYRLADGSSYVETPSPFNFGLNYSPNESVQVGAYYMYGNQIGLTATFAIDPNSRYAQQGRETAPVPVAVSPAAAASWQAGPAYDAAIGAPLAEAMRHEGLRLIGIQSGGGEMRVRYENTRYRSEAQAAGRLARILTQLAPASVQQFRLEPVAEGLAKSAIVIPRADLVALENELGAAEAMRPRVRIEEAGSADGLSLVEDPRPRFEWGISPTANFTVFGPEKRLQYQVSVRAQASYRLAPGLELEGAVIQRVMGETGDPSVTSPRPQDTYVPVVRRDVGYYLQADGPQIEKLTLTHLSNPYPNIYVRASGGYLERMYGGVSAEVLWKPVNSRFGLGAELTYAVKRDFEGLGFQDYDAVTGFVSAYYEFADDFIGRVDLGRYLAGDWGGTVTLERELPNGWRLGGYFTLTDVPFDDFGEGSFDKGILLTIPVDWLIGSSSRETKSLNLQSLTRDGGQRVDTGDGLYSLVRDGHIDDVDESWERFWQ